MTSKSSKYNNHTQDYEDYLRKANYKTSSDCLSSEKSASNQSKNYQERLLKSIERKAMKDQYGTRAATKILEGYETKKS